MDQKRFCCDVCQSILPIFFIVSGLTFRSLIHFEFIFVCGVRECSSFIVFLVAILFSQDHLLKSLSLTQLHMRASFVKNKLHIGAQIYFWAFYLVPFVYISVFVPLPYCVNDCSFVV